MPGNTKMGYEGVFFIGAPGATATVQVENATDVTYNLDTEKGSTAVRGDGSSPPMKTETVTQLMASFEFTMINDVTDNVLEQLRVAAASGAGLALRCKDYAAGKGFDGDVTVTMNHGEPLAGEQTYDFTLTPSRDYGRAPQAYV